MNRKGYMLVEIVLASAIAFGVAFFIVSLTIKLKNKNDDVLVSSQVSVDQAIITNKFMTYAIDEQENFNCEQIKINNNTITYKGELIDIVNDYANITSYKCTNNNGTIKISFPVEILQLKNKDYDIDVEYKYIIGDLSHPQLLVSVVGGNTYTKSKTATIKLVDNEGMASGAYKVKYGWSTGYLSCDKMTNELTFNVAYNQKEVSQNVTISGQNGAGMLYACNMSRVNDLYDNELPANMVASDYMYLDNTGPVIELGTYTAGTFGSSATVQIKAIDTLSGVAYNSFTKDDLDVYIASTKINNISLTHTGNGNYNLVVTNNNYRGNLKINIASGKVSDNVGNVNASKEVTPNIKFEACSTTVDRPSCTGYSGCSVAYRQQTGTKTRTCTHKYYSATNTDYLCSTGSQYTDSASCNGASDACSSTYDSPSCGNYGGCSVTWVVETGTKTRTCTHKNYSNYIGDYLCSTGSSYTERTSCHGSRRGSWFYSNYRTQQGGSICAANCPGTCSYQNGTSVWACVPESGIQPTAAYQRSGGSCWCYK